MTAAKEDTNVEHMRHMNLVTCTACVLFSALHQSMTLWEVHKLLTKSSFNRKPQRNDNIPFCD